MVKAYLPCFINAGFSLQWCFNPDEASLSFLHFLLYHFFVRRGICSFQSLFTIVLFPFISEILHFFRDWLLCSCLSIFISELVSEIAFSCRFLFSFLFEESERQMDQPIDTRWALLGAINGGLAYFLSVSFVLYQ